MRRILLYVLILFIGYSCNLKSDINKNKEKVLQDSLRLDSLRKEGCDSLLNYISETNSGKVNLPDSLPKNINDCIKQLDTCTNDNIKEWIKCVTEREYVSTLHHGFGMYLRNNWGLWAESDLAKYFYSIGIYHPDDMSSIILECFYQYVNTGKYSIDDKVDYLKKYYKDNWEKQKEREDSLNRINLPEYTKTKRFIDSLHKAVDYDSKISKIPGLVMDSLNFFIEKKRGDTTLLWSGGGGGGISKTEYLKIVKNESFGRTIFFESIGSDGTINIVHLKRQVFLKRDGALFFYDNKNGFVLILSPQMINNPEKINEWENLKTCSFNKSFIKTIWKLNNKKYYYIELQGDCYGTGSKVRYFFDEDINVIFDKNVIKKLWGSRKLFESNHK